MFSNLIPDLYVKSIYEIDFDLLKQRGIQGIVTDLDNTLIEWNRPEATPELINWILKMKGMGFSIVIVSNNKRERVARVAEPLGIPFIYRAKKPTKISFKQAIKNLKLPVKKTVVIGDQIFTDVLGGNRMGFYTILVVPVAENDGIATKFNRFMERAILNWMKKRGFIPWEERNG